jgi:hypothetical protein
MSLILRALARALEPNLSPMFSRSFSVYHTVQVPGDYAKWCLENPEAYERKLARQQAYLDRVRSTKPEVYRRRLDTAVTRSRQQYQDPVKGAQMRERTRLRDLSRRGDERHKFYRCLLN